MDEERPVADAVHETGSCCVSRRPASSRRGDCEHLTMVTCVRCGRTYAQRIADAGGR
jgi:hypothetical protein